MIGLEASASWTTTMGEEPGLLMVSMVTVLTPVTITLASFTVSAGSLVKVTVKTGEAVLGSFHPGWLGRTSDGSDPMIFGVPDI